jgi:dephospho-CoA kinase
MILITGKTGVGKTTILKETKLNNIYYMDDVIKNKFYNFYNKLY